MFHIWSNFLRFADNMCQTLYKFTILSFHASKLIHTSIVHNYCAVLEPFTSNHVRRHVDKSQWMQSCISLFWSLWLILLNALDRAFSDLPRQDLFRSTTDTYSELYTRYIFWTLGWGLFWILNEACFVRWAGGIQNYWQELFKFCAEAFSERWAKPFPELWKRFMP
jgi:hypothetical protein